MRRGLLLTLTEPPAGMEEEFNAWYDSEHIPERLAIPGFRSARRWVRGRTYVATYELDSAQVLQSKPYLARFQNQTPWSRRCLGALVLFKRWACEQIEPGNADPQDAAAGIVFSDTPLDLRHVLQARRFAPSSGEEISLYELSNEQDQPGAFVYRLYAS